jgi:hypothetical protein
VQAALSTLPLFHELLGFRFRKLKFYPRIARIDANRNCFDCSGGFFKRDALAKAQVSMP